MQGIENKDNEFETKVNSIQSGRERVPETAIMGLAYIKLRLATLNVRLQSLFALVNRKNEKKDSLNQLLMDINEKGDDLYNNHQVKKVINKNKAVKKLFMIYKQGLFIATNEINSM
jgi:hypothetical protein